MRCVTMVVCLDRVCRQAAITNTSFPREDGALASAVRLLQLRARSSRDVERTALLSQVCERRCRLLTYCEAHAGLLRC